MPGTRPGMTHYFRIRRLNRASSRTKASKRAFAANNSRSVSTSIADDADAHRNSARCARSPRSVKVRMRSLITIQDFRRRALLIVGEERRLAEPLPQRLAFQAQRGDLVEVGHEAQIAAEALAEPVRGPKAILCAGIVRREARETYLHPNSCLKSIRYSLAKRRRFEQTPLLLSTPLRTECNAIAASDRCDAYACTGPSGNCPLSR